MDPTEGNAVETTRRSCGSGTGALARSSPKSLRSHLYGEIRTLQRLSLDCLEFGGQASGSLLPGVSGVGFSRLGVRVEISECSVCTPLELWPKAVLLGDAVTVRHSNSGVWGVG